MDHKEKYEQALERGRIFRDHLLETGDKGIAWEIEYIFPELKVSEDERIRKGLIKAVSGILKGNTLYGTDVTREEALAWLEKQGEKKDYYTKQELIDMGFSFTLNGDIVTPDEMMEDMKKYLAWEEKHDEQKQADTPKFKVGD